MDYEDQENMEQQDFAAQRRAERERKRKRKYLIARLKLVAIVAVFVFLIVLIIVLLSKCNSGGSTPETTVPVTETTVPVSTEIETPPATTVPVLNVNFSLSDDELVFINSENQIPATYVIADKVSFKGVTLSRLCYNTEDEVNEPKFQQMINDMRKALGNENCVTYEGGWISDEEQQSRFNVELSKYDGLPDAEAEDLAAEAVARPGFCEYQSGLDIDLFDTGKTERDESQDNSEVQEWLRENSWKYGFVERYPESKAGITGVDYAPWHYRYVGHEAAQYMHDNNLCLEELIDLLKNQ